MNDPQVLQREKLLFAYTAALEAGDFARVEHILQQAGSDPILERQVIEINAALSQAYAQTLTPVGATPPVENRWNGFKARLSRWISSPVWRRPLLRAAAGVAGVALVLVVVVMALLGPAVGKIFSNVTLSAPPGKYPYSGQAPTTAPAATAAPAATQRAGVHDTYNPYPAPEVSQPQAERLIVRNGALNLVVTDTRQARQAVMDLIAGYAAEGAFVVSSNESYIYGSQMPLIAMTLRVPVKHFNESVDRLVGLADQVLQRQETAADVTQSYVDVSARIEALQTSRERLLQIIKDAKNTDDLLRAEQELSQREAELEAAKANQQYLSQTAALSSITLELRPAITSQPVTEGPWNPAATFYTAVRTLTANLIGLADGSITFAIVVLPWLVVIGLVVYGVIRLARRKR